MARSESVESVCQKIIRAGYRALSIKNHPDTGGSHDAMVALNTARDRLESLVSNSESDIFSTIFGPIRAQPFTWTPWEEWAEEARATKTRKSKPLGIRIGPRWCEIDAVKILAEEGEMLSFRLLAHIWVVPRSAIKPDSPVLSLGDSGTLILLTSVARQLGLLRAAGIGL